LLTGARKKLILLLTIYLSLLVKNHLSQDLSPPVSIKLETDPGLKVKPLKSMAVFLWVFFLVRARWIPYLGIMPKGLDQESLLSLKVPTLLTR